MSATQRQVFSSALTGKSEDQDWENTVWSGYRTPQARTPGTRAFRLSHRLMVSFIAAGSGEAGALAPARADQERVIGLDSGHGAYSRAFDLEPIE